MNFRPFLRSISLTSISVLLLVLAWGALAGGIRQFSRSNTVGQQLETIIQLMCGLLSLLTILTCFWWPLWAKPIRIAWIISFVTAAGLSSLVWGPPMPLIGLFFALGALFLSLTIVWVLRRLSRGDYYTSRHPVRAAGIREDASFHDGAS